MNWEALGAIGETVAAVAVVASLIYLAIQTRANSRALKAQAIWNAETIFGELNFNQAADPQLAELVERAFAPHSTIEGFSPSERAQLRLAIRGAIQYNQAQWSLWKEGILPTEVWERRKRFAAGTAALPALRGIWIEEISSHNVAPEFRAEIEALESDA